LLIRVAVISRISFPLQLFLMVLVGPLIVFVNAVFLFTWVSHALVTAELQFLAVDCWFSSLSRPASLFLLFFLVGLPSDTLFGYRHVAISLGQLLCCCRNLHLFFLFLWLFFFGWSAL
jgi:hypothetical protein